MDIARFRPAEYDCHARDLSAFVDPVRHDWEEVGAGRKRRIKVGHHVVLPDEGMGPAALRVLSASHRLAFIVDAECDPV